MRLSAAKDSEELPGPKPFWTRRRARRALLHARGDLRGQWELYEYDVEAAEEGEEALTPIAPQTSGVLG